MHRVTLIIVSAVFLCGAHGGMVNTERPIAHQPNTEQSQVVVEPVRTIDEKGLRKLIKTRNKKVLFLNIWATWCAPCVEEFPDLVKLSQHYNPNEVEIVAISADFPDEVDSKILPFLKKQKVSFKTYVAKFENQDSFINSLNKSWNGALPATFIYDAKGKQRFFTIGKSNFERFKNEIEKVRGKT